MNISGSSSNWDISSFYDKLCPVIANDMEIRTILCEVWRKILELNSLISLITFFSRELVDGLNTVCIDGTLTVICLPDDSDHRTKFLRCKQDVSLFFHSGLYMYVNMMTFLEPCYIDGPALWCINLYSRRHRRIEEIIRWNTKATRLKFQFMHQQFALAPHDTWPMLLTRPTSKSEWATWDGHFGI